MDEKDIPKAQRTLAIDFDGVIHKYSRGWQDGSAYDVPVDGVEAALIRLREAGFKLVILTTRDIGQVQTWLLRYGMEDLIDQITSVKVPAVAYIDDRAVRFTNWTDICNLFC